MSTLFGNTCLVLAALLSSLLVSSAFNYKPPHGGDGGASAYPIWIMLLLFAFLCLMTLATITIAQQGGWAWISAHWIIRFLLVGFGLLSAVFALSISAMEMQDGGSGTSWQLVLSRWALVGIPLVLIASGFILLNSSIRESVPVAFYKWPLAAMLLLGIGGIGTAIFEWITADSPMVARQKYEAAPHIKAASLQEIEDADLEEGMVRILEYTGTAYPPEVREKASAKIKAHPTWRQDLITLLADDRALSVFSFLASNEVADKKQFAQPVNTGALSVAQFIRHTIQGTSPSNFSAEMFADEVDRTLRTIDQFQGMGVDYLPAVRAMRAALDEPSGGKKPPFKCSLVLDTWINERLISE